MTKIESMIERMIEQRVAATIERMMGATSPVADVQTEAPIFPAEPRKVEPRKAPQQPRNVGAYKRYVIVRNRRGNPIDPGTVPAAYMVVYRALAKRKNGATARELETLSGRKQKTVESALWFLRQRGAVESVVVENGR